LSLTLATTIQEAPQYEEFYGFVQSPFTLAPDPRFLYLSESHDGALQLLLQSIRRKEGIIVLTGDIGTGKTTVCRSVLERLDMNSFTSLLLNPFLSVEEMLREILLDFGVVSRDAVRSGRVAAATKHDLVSTLHEFLISLVPIGGTGILMIDEAQHLSPQVLEELRVISNLETNQSKLLQIVLVGQLNLLDVLAAPELRQLDQRISLRATLTPLTRADLEAYIGHRLAVARGSSSVNFDAQALDAIHATSEGVPRVVNLLCDRALMLGARDGISVITEDIVTEAADGLGLRPPRAARWAWTRGWAWTQGARRWVPIVATILAVLATLAVLTLVLI
jgi:general secretion pathway protein A